ncbi:winged helix-turn-helix domain-containing protein [Vibrio hippocampi]|uniref:OmpR/PhoB-type domain-containing protein n=1 Tax=Vibrio hippocampi TaxID=654686 RepID=A0ABN8DFX2_9VIBR|nr:hypothetical protein [Vibrio hippocampi]CAH0525360.1 hypothetical protein VHP8226_00936 [Vibrio hippocampi]
MEKCFIASCNCCLNGDYYTEIRGAKPLGIISRNGSSNFHQRLICLLTSGAAGTVYSTQEIRDFVWVGKQVGEGSVPQLVHHTRKFLPEGYDIVSLRGKGYFLFNPAAPVCRLSGDSGYEANERLI